MMSIHIPEKNEEDLKKYIFSESLASNLKGLIHGNKNREAPEKITGVSLRGKSVRPRPGLIKPRFKANGDPKKEDHYTEK